MQADETDKLANLAAAETEPHRRTLRVEQDAAPRPATLRVEQPAPPVTPGTLRVEEPPADALQEQVPSVHAAPAHVRILGDVEPGTMLFGEYTVVKTVQEHEHDQPGIFLATDAAGCTIIIKVHPRDYTPDPEVHSRLPALRHPNIIRTFAYGERDGYYYETQEYCTGGTAAQLVPEVGAPVTQERINWVFYELLPQVHAGLSYLHEQGIVHRDVKPSNIYVRREPSGDVFLLGDFDISSTLELSRASRLTQRTWLTLEYAAPEQFPQLSAHGGRLAARISRKSDYWSLAITLLELLVGTTTLHQIGPELVQGFHMKGRRVELPDGLPENVTLLLRGMLIRDDELRWGGAQVTRWLRRQNTAEDKALIERDMTYAGYQAIAPYRIEELSADNLHDLAQVLASKPEPALEDLMGGEALLNWIAQQDTNIARDMRRDRDRWRSMPRVALQCVIQTLDPAQPYRFADGSEARTTEQWALQAIKLSQAEGRLRLDLASLEVHNQLAMWLRLKAPPEADVAQAVQELAGYPATERAEELLFLLQPSRPLGIGENLQAQTPDDFVKLAYGKPEDWRQGIPACYKSALAAWQSGVLEGWLRQRGNKELAFQCGETGKAFVAHPEGGFETALRLLDPRLPKVKLVIDRRTLPQTAHVPYGDVRVLELNYRTEGPGIPFGALTQSPQMPGVTLGEHVISVRTGSTELRLTSGADTTGTKVYQGKLVLESGVAELAGGPLQVRYHIGFPHAVTLERVLAGAALGAFLLGFPRLIAWLLGQQGIFHWTQIDIKALWDDAVNLRFSTLGIVLLALLLGLGLFLAWRLWINAVKEAEP